MDSEPRGTIQIPDNPEIAALVLDYHRASRAKELEVGRVGEWLGSRDNAVIYLACAVIGASMVAAILAALINTPVSADLAKGFVALAISALGYMFGSIGRREHHGD